MRKSELLCGSMSSSSEDYKMDTTDLLAIYGAVLASIGVLLHVINYLRQQPKLLIDVNFYQRVDSAKGPQFLPLPKDVSNPDDYHLGIEVTNTGKGGITVKQMGFHVSPPEIVGDEEVDVVFVGDSDLPRHLSEGEGHLTVSNPGQLRKSQIRYGTVRDTTGREWRSKEWPLN